MVARSNPTPKTAVRGTCRLCGCTDEHACEGTGCAWVDSSHSLCTACLPKISLAELQPLYFAELNRQYKPGQAVAFRQMPPMVLAVVEASALVGAIDLALRHPDIDRLTNTKPLVEAIRNACAEKLGQMLGPAAIEVLRRGRDPKFDVEASV